MSTHNAPETTQIFQNQLLLPQAQNTKNASKQQPNPYVIIELFLVFSFKMCHKCKDNFLI